MYNLKFFLRLLGRSVTLNRNELEFASPKRILALLLLLPLLCFLLLSNQFFLLLDNIFFPRFRRQSTGDPVFITGVPRSATTFVFDQLNSDEEHFISFTLWELFFAPSICQRYIFSFIQQIDAFFFSPLEKLLRWLDRLIFKNMEGIHDLSLFKAEEDEILFLYNLSSLYFFYIFPDAQTLDPLFRHDEALPEKVRKKNISFYKSCLKRHLYYHDPNNQRIFLSKNPTFTPRLNSLSESFPTARFIFPLRSIYSTLPSMISLHSHVLGMSCSLREPYPIQEATREKIINWYRYAGQFHEEIGDRGMTIYFSELKSGKIDVRGSVGDFLGLKISPSAEEQDKKHRSKHEYPKDLGIDQQVFQEKLGPFFDKHMPSWKEELLRPPSS